MGLISRVSSRTYRQLWAGSVPVPKKKKKPKKQTPVVATQRSPAVVIQLSRQRPHNSLHQIPINSNSRHSNTVFRPSNSNLATTTAASLSPTTTSVSTTTQPEYDDCSAYPAECHQPISSELPAATGAAS